MVKCLPRPVVTAGAPVQDAVSPLLALDSAALERRRTEWLVASLAHELRQPLSVLQTALEVVKIAEDARAAGDVLGVMERQLNRMNCVVQDLLDASRWATGKILLRKQRLDARVVLCNAARDATSAMTDRGHRLLIATPHEPVWVDADPERLHQALANLIDNAVKFTEPPGEISLEAEARFATVRLSVSDNGRGIAPEDLLRIFDRFAQVRPLEGAGGLGIGLSVVRDIVVLHDGGIEAHSDGPGCGCAFTITLPRPTRA